jgi:hypothetical protein
LLFLNHIEIASAEPHDKGLQYELAEAESVLKSATYIQDSSSSTYPEPEATDIDYGTEFQESLSDNVDDEASEVAADEDDFDESSPVSDLWNKASRGIPTAWYIRAVISLIAVLALLSIFFRFIFPRLVQQNPQWRQSPQNTPIPNTTEPLNTRAMPPSKGPKSVKQPKRPPLLWVVLVGLIAIPFRLVTQIVRWPFKLMTQSSPSPEPELETIERSSDITPTAIQPQAAPEQSVQTVSGLPINSLPLTVVQEFPLPQSLRLQLVTVWDKYLVILAAPQSTELMGEVLCDINAGYVRFEETSGVLSPLVQWVFEYHSDVVQQCVDAVALLSQDALNEEASAAQQSEPSVVNPSPDPAQNPPLESNHSPSSSVAAVTTVSVSAEALSESQQPNTQLERASSSPDNEQTQFASKTPGAEPLSSNHLVVIDPIDPDSLQTPDDGLYLKYLTPSSSTGALNRTPVAFDESFLEPAEQAPVDYFTESSTTPSPSTSSLNNPPSVQLHSSETSPEPWFASDSPEQFVQSSAMKETLNQMIHEVLASEGMVRPEPESEIPPTQNQGRLEQSFTGRQDRIEEKRVEAERVDTDNGGFTEPESPVLNLASDEMVIDSDIPPEFLKEPPVQNTESPKPQKNLSDMLPQPIEQPSLSDKAPPLNPSPFNPKSAVSEPEIEPQQSSKSDNLQEKLSEFKPVAEPLVPQELTQAPVEEPKVEEVPEVKSVEKSETIVLGEIDLDAHLKPESSAESSQKILLEEKREDKSESISSPLDSVEPISSPPELKPALPPLSERLALASAATFQEEPPESFTEALDRPATLSSSSTDNDASSFLDDAYPLSGLSRQKSTHSHSIDAQENDRQTNDSDSLQTLLFPEQAEPQPRHQPGQKPEEPSAPVSRPSSMSERRQINVPSPTPPPPPVAQRPNPIAPMPEEIVVMDDYDDTF